MKVTKVSPKVVLLEFPSIKELTLHMWRFQEFYEGEEGIKGCLMYTFDEFVDKYSDDSGMLDYFSYWEGFNIPMEVIRSIQLRVPDFYFSRRENEVLISLCDTENDGYVIATVEGDTIAQRHEIAHARFYLDQKYHQAITVFVESMAHNSYDLYSRMTSDLKSAGYIQEVFTDEISAYLVAWNEDDRKDVFPDITNEEVEKYRKKLSDLYDKSPE